MSERAGWNLKEGAEIAAGRLALKKLGGGKRYEVYLAWDEKLFSHVVVKMVRPDQVASSRSIPDLEREMGILERLAHPMLVRTFGAVLEGDRPHLVLEHFEGPTLRKLIKSHGPLPLEQLVPLAVRISGVLHYLAAESVVHLDVKPSNVVMEAPPKLIDLSVARTLPGTSKIKRPIGTRKYMSPEQCDPERLGPIGSPADVWGLGATLYEAATGKRAFETPRRDLVSDDDPIETRFPQLVEDPRPLPKSMPKLVGDPILACLERAPDKRPLAAEVARSFEPILERLPDKPRLTRGRPRSVDK